MEKEWKFNTKQTGEALELLTSLNDNSVDLVFLDPQYEKVSNVVQLNYPLHYQSDYQIMQLLKEVERILKPSSFCLLWVNKSILGTDRVPAWLVKSPALRIVDFLVWYKSNFQIGLGAYFRSSAEYAFLLQKHPTNSKLFTNRSFPSVWDENQLAVKYKIHPHQKPKEFLKTFILATTKKEDLIVDPCAGSFIVLEVCQETNRNFLGCDLTMEALENFYSNR